MTTIGSDHNTTLEIALPQRPVLVQDSLHWLMLALLIIIIASWYFGLYRAASPVSPRTTPIHHLDTSCGGVATPC
jgi:cytochrome b561